MNTRQKIQNVRLEVGVSVGRSESLVEEFEVVEEGVHGNVAGLFAEVSGEVEGYGVVEETGSGEVEGVVEQLSSIVDVDGGEVVGEKMVDDETPVGFVVVNAVVA